MLPVGVPRTVAERSLFPASGVSAKHRLTFAIMGARTTHRGCERMFEAVSLEGFGFGCGLCGAPVDGEAPKLPVRACRIHRATTQYMC